MNPSKMTEGQKTGPKVPSFAEKAPSLPSLRAFTQTSVMREQNFFPFRKRVTPKCFKTRQTRQTGFWGTNCN